MITLPKTVKIVEVGPRDGLQNESKTLAIDLKVEFINRLNETGLKTIEVGSFVSPKWVPQMADSADVFQRIHKKSTISYPILIPNLKGLEKAIEFGVEEIAILCAASETFSQKNINCSIAQSIERFTEVIDKARQHKMKIRGYISCVLGCPYEGEIKPEKVAFVADKLFQLGCYEISLGDTIGVGTPLKAVKLIETVTDKVATENLAVHFHDVYGQALVNIYATLQLGISIIDSSIAGLGGCPYAPGASGNVATEDVLYLLNGLGIETGVDLEKLLHVSKFISKSLNKKPNSKVAKTCR